MTNRKLTSLEQLEKLTDSLVNDIIELSDEDILIESEKQYDDTTVEIERLKNVINNALLMASKTKLINAKNHVNAYKNEIIKSNVVSLSITEKKSIIKKFTRNDSELQHKLTLAARKGEGIQSDNDIEGMFDDMLELGLIDEEGKAK